MQTFFSRFVLFTMAVVATMALETEGQKNVQERPVAPDVLAPMSPSSQCYLIGVVSFFVFALAALLGVRALMEIDYSDDTLLMVEVAESVDEK
ncbi:hypothetical protein C3747_2g1502c [Trypanosoma cruzi]|uniref:Uncharacterized protein n=2 Tax=Trypanosoma cruzi TaxID=5693 RepID=Q4DRC9_TRYCC|nr:hypothetical protein, conserved [Trypanosoma cruzi]EAN95098.1 hypothetical protein, conserved [Trypanosoma cruzi]KAF8292741.1 hypothetical protein TcYC6_0113870 [Trypanosoma cruzi]PWV21657.1 hypothetical protein C3747_2g1502c [Trypanosoma cruzi]|eukprot:XP_816949.1 hypothetical protein [Trypanosoma cruzi strain CL Brener]